MNMNIKKELILRSIKAGLSLNKAYILAECNDDELEILKNDQSFIKDIELHKILEQKRLINQFNKALNNAVKSGNTAAIERRLARIDPENWGDDNDDKDKINVSFYLPKNGR